MKKIYFSILGLAAFIPLAASAAGSASLTISPPSASYKVGQTFSATISANPNNGNLDTVRLNIKFSANQLEVQNFSLNPTFGFTAGGNGFDNTNGTLTWGAGIAGGTDKGTIFGTINFKVKGTGQAQVTISPDSLVLFDGQNVFDGKSASALYSLAAAVIAPVPPVQTPQPAPKKQIAPQPAQTVTPEPVAETPPANVVPQTNDQNSLVPINEDTAAAAVTKTFNTRDKIILGIVLALAVFLIFTVIYKIVEKRRMLFEEKL